MPKGRSGGRGGGRDIMPMPTPRNRFSEVPKAEIPRSAFDRSHTHKTTFDAGVLVPIYVDEALPGDTYNLRMSAFARLVTPIFPIMDNLHLETFFFFVPYRLVWDNWEKFNGAQDSPGDSTDFTIPRVADAEPDVTVGTLADYMGIPLGLDYSEVNVSALPFRAYQLIWNEWFRDQNLQVPTPITTGDGPDDIPFGPLQRGKRHDYFTSALPWPQKGDAVQMPGAALERAYVHHLQSIGSDVSAFRGLGTSANHFFDTGAALLDVSASTTSVGPQPSNLFAYTPDAGATINELRQAFQVQKLLERDARGGTRYIEIIRSHFGVTSPDARLQRPEYLGGGHSLVNITPIAQTAEGTGTFVGELAAMGTGSMSGHGFTQSFTEHGVILGLMCAYADLTYQQGLHRMWSRRTRYDFFWPALAHIGEQAILNKEIWVSNSPATDDGVFGYQERFAEYRYNPSRISGLFRSDAPSSLDAWHLSQDFATLPVLNADFIREDPPIDRITALPSEPDFLFDSFFKIRCARPMPVYGVPGMVDHF